MADTYAQIVAGQDEATVFTNLINLLKALPSGLSLPTSYWGSGDPIPVILQHGLAPLLSTLRGYASKIAQGGFLRPAQRLAEADIATWNADPSQTFLGVLAQEIFNVAPKDPAFALGTWQVQNAGPAVTLPATFTVSTADGKLKYTLVGGAITVPNGTSYVTIQAAATGPEYNVSAGTITKLVTSVAGITGSNQPQPPSTSWLIDFGGLRETPASVAARCKANWGRLATLQTSPADAYVALALDSSITGTSAPKKVTVWPHYKDGVGHSSNSITLYLAGDAGPVTNGEAAQVQAALRPWIGLHDELVAAPCGSVTYSPALTAYVAVDADILPASTALYQQLVLLQQRLPIGGTCYAFDIRRACALVPQIVEVEDALADFVPAKNQLITLGTGGLTVAVGP